jgi:2-keto-4-pentenoate hydratase/2-oxohepta-3-ene-1,7-dioic acid hydratase in catechol pathway
MSSPAVHGYRLLTYRENGAPMPGVLVGDRVHPAAELLDGSGVDASSVLAILESWPEAHAQLQQAARRVAPDRGAPLERIELLAPILYPRAIFCAGANYWDHVEEMEGPVDRAGRPEEPWFFVKTAAHSVIADGDPVPYPAKSQALDYEAELAVVLGRPASSVTAECAADVIAGYTILNDLSARDLMTRSDRPPSMTYDWIGQKCFAGAAPMGPWITPSAYVEDPHDLLIRLWVNDALKQDSHTGQLIHDVYEQIEWLSHQLPLLPGDVIATGTPAGVGMPRGDYLRKGDVVRIEIERCGALTNPIA